MNRQMHEICSYVLEKALKSGAENCKVKYYKERSIDIKYRESKSEVVKEATKQNLIVNLYLKGKYSSQSTPDLRKNALDEFLNKAIQNTKYVEEDPGRSLPPNDYIKENIDRDLQLYDQDYAGFTIDDRHRIARDIEQVCLEKGGDRIISVEAGSSDTEWEETILASNGFNGYTKSTDFWAGASLTVKDEGDRKPAGYYWTGCRHIKDLPSVENIGETAVKKTFHLIGGRKINTEKLPVIIENRVVSTILHGFLSALYGSNIQQKRSFLTEKKNKSTGSRLFTLIDDPFILRGLGSRLFDNDGFPSKIRTIVNEGIVQDFFIDWYYSRKLNSEPTSGSFSNLIIPPGSKSLKDLMKDIGRGILITGFIGGNSNSTTGDFSLGITGKLFENGVPVQSVSEMNIADNHQEFWNKLVAIGNDPWKFSSLIMPSLVIDDVIVAGK